MKYIVVLGDGMADYPMDALSGKTPLMVANKPNIDSLAQKGVLGMCKTVPDGMKPGSDVANMGAMGYNPLNCYTGRSPLEAVSMGIKMSDTDIALRTNLVTLSSEPNYADKKMLDYSAGEISSDEAAELIAAVDSVLGTNALKFYPGVSYRHCLIWQNGRVNLGLTPPHDISGRVIGEYLPPEPIFLELMKKSYEILKDHPLNKSRIERGLNPANSIWLWGEGTRPSMEKFFDMYGVNGSVISAVDLIKGIGICAGMRSIDVPGATGNLHTNFVGKGQAALSELLSGQEYVYIHVEAPDECGHQGDLPGKIKAIELIDKNIVGPIVSGLRAAGEDFSMLIMPDHPTPISTMTHASDPVPFLIYTSSNEVLGAVAYTEETALASGLYIDEGQKLAKMFLNK